MTMTKVKSCQSKISNSVTLKVDVSFIPQCKWTLLKSWNTLWFLFIPFALPRDLANTTFNRNNMFTSHKLVCHCVCNKT